MTDDSEHSQSDTITYDDPAGRMEREKIMAQLKRGNSPSPDFHTEDEEEDRRDHKIDAVGLICGMITWSFAETAKCIVSRDKISLQFRLHLTWSELTGDCSSS